MAFSPDSSWQQLLLACSMAIEQFLALRHCPHVLTRPSHPRVCLFAYLTGDHFASLHLRHWIVFLAILFSHCCPLAGYLSSCSQKICWYVGNKSKLIEWFFWGVSRYATRQDFYAIRPKVVRKQVESCESPRLGGLKLAVLLVPWLVMDVFDNRCMSKVQEHDLFKLFPSILK